MEIDCKININGKDYKFEPVDYNSQRFVMQVNENYELIRDLLNWNKPVECWTMVHKYSHTLSGEKKDEEIRSVVYHGRIVKDEEFMKMLLDHIFSELVILSSDGEDLNIKF